MERSELAVLLRGDPSSETKGPLVHVIESSEPKVFMQAFSSAVSCGGLVFLIDPNYGSEEKKIITQLIESAKDDISDNKRGWLMIASGGTSGKIKFARHDQATLAFAVDGFCKHFHVSQVNWVGILPLYHVSGFVAWIRTVLTGGSYISWDWKKIEAGDLPKIERSQDKKDSKWFISLVPTQLQRIMTAPHHERILDWLRLFDGVFIGGGPIWPSLADQAAQFKLPLCLSYGMTETAAMIAALKPDEFLSGRRDSGKMLPHAEVSINDQGCVEINSGSLFLGYYPEFNPVPKFTTQDLGFVDNEGHLTIQGRRDAVIITGGKKVDPLEVEAVLRASGLFDDIAVLGLPDKEWGQSVVACYPKSLKELDMHKVDEHVKMLSAHQRPKQFIALENWPRNLQGKLNRLELLKQISP